jgi:hypothetical protein
MLEDVCRYNLHSVLQTASPKLTSYRRKTKNESQEREQDRVFIQNLKSIQDSSSSWGIKGSSDRIKVDEVIYNTHVFLSVFGHDSCAGRPEVQRGALCW